nr:GlsB/YeaQ/YmgE family stress response membrane protein [Anaerolineae bacterium]
MSFETILSVIGWVITGAIAGYVASLILRVERQGCFINIGIGIVGAFVGALIIRLVFPALLTLFGTGPIAGFFNAMFHAILGSVILLVLYELIVPGKQLGVRRRERKSRRRR